jgi:hypothetical protein
MAKKVDVGKVAGNGPRSIMMPKVRVEPAQQVRYMRAINKRSEGVGQGVITYAFCVREAMDQWSDRQLGNVKG